MPVVVLSLKYCSEVVGSDSEAALRTPHWPAELVGRLFSLKVHRVPHRTVAASPLAQKQEFERNLWVTVKFANQRDTEKMRQGPDFERSFRIQM